MSGANVVTEEPPSPDTRDAAAAGQSAWAVACSVGVIAVGVLLRLIEFWRNQPLSVDEAALARNVLARSWRALLLQPLDFAQIEPPGFLLLQKAATLVLGSSEAALRLMPLLAGCVGVVLAFAVGRRLFTPGAAWGFTALIGLATPLVTYAATAKQYAFDVMATLAVILITLDVVQPRSIRRAAAMGLAAASTVLFSFTAVFILASAALAAVIRIWRARPRESRTAHFIFAVAAVSGAAVGVVLGRAAMTPVDAEYMQWFWMIGFAPSAPGSVAHLAWIWRGVTGIFGQTLHYRGSIVWTALLLVGAVSFVRRRQPDTAVLLAGPLVLVLAASTAHLYPFASGRLQHFLVPSTLMLGVAGASALGTRLRRASPLAAHVPLVVLLGSGLHASTRSDVPADIRRPDVRSFVARARDTWQPGDVLFVHYFDAQPTLFYAAAAGLPAADQVIGPCSMGSGRAYLDALHALPGRSRVWLAMSQTSNLEGDLMRSYLSAAGARLLPTQDRSLGSFGFLYDLREFGENGVTPQAFPLPDDLRHDVPYRWSCYGVFSPAARP